MKVAVIGGGSTYTPELVEGFGLRQGVLPVEELVLHDIDQGRLDVVGGLAERILRKLEFPGRLTTGGEQYSVDSLVRLSRRTPHQVGDGVHGNGRRPVR